MKEMFKPAIEITLLTRDRIRARGIHITHTYAGWISGVPTAETNQEQLSEIPDCAREIFGDFPVHVVHPEFEKPEIADWKGSGTPQLMPPFQVMAIFDGKPISSGFSSSLIACWHQHSVPPLLENGIRSTLREIVWKDLAKDWEL